jgi:ABC-2 type transport system ATP-binding protein
MHRSALGSFGQVPVVEVEELVVRYGDLVAVDGISFTADAGQVTAVLGPNGAGKTSTIEVLEGYRRPAAGRVRVLGLDPTRDHGRLVAQIGVMLQSGGVYPGIRAGEVARLFCGLYGDVRQPEELLDLVGLTARAGSTWKQLSGGEQQRLSLALALAGDPHVAFLDEPTASVDVAGRQVVRAVIRDLAAKGCCVLLTTHELDEAERVADHVIIIDRGRIAAWGSPAELRSRTAGDEIRFSAPTGLDTASLGVLLGATVSEPTPAEYLVAAAPSPAAIAAIAGWLAERDVALADLRAGRQTLEDVFLRLTAEPGKAAE